MSPTDEAGDQPATATPTATPEARLVSAPLVSAAALRAAAALGTLLAEENAALAACDMPRAVATAARKAAIAQQLRLALDAPADTQADLAATDRLRELARENKRLLEQALAIQGRVIATLVRAIPSTRVGYANGKVSRTAATASPVSLSARA